MWELGYLPIHFNAVDDKNQSIYHTNVMMALAKHMPLFVLKVSKIMQKGKISKKLKWNQSYYHCNKPQTNESICNALELINKEGNVFSFV